MKSLDGSSSSSEGMNTSVRLIHRSKKIGALGRVICVYGCLVHYTLENYCPGQIYENKECYAVCLAFVDTFLAVFDVLLCCKVNWFD